MPVLSNTLVDTSGLSDNDNPVFPLPLSNSAFSLDSSGVAGFFGGDSSVAGMATVNLIPGRRWGGWYNTPGSYEIAKQYGPLGDLKVYHGFFPEGEKNPAKLFKLDGQDGPQFVAVHSGTSFARTGHLADLIMQKAEETPVRGDRRFDGREGTKPSVTVINLPDSYIGPSYHPDLPPSSKAWFSLIPILVSVGACVLCALVADWFCFASIAVGIVAHGLACYVIGSGRLTFQHPKPALNAPPGDGVLKAENALVVLVGPESAVNAFTRGHFRLQYGEEPADNVGTEATHSEVSTGDKPGVHPYGYLSSRFLFDWTIQRMAPWCWRPPQYLIGHCAVLLMGQFLVQLLLIPLGTLFGQLMFIATVVASWLYNTHISSINREEIQTQILFNVLKLEERDVDIHKYQLSTWTATVTFVCFVLSSVHPLDDPLEFLDAMIPNNTVAWKEWKEKMKVELKDRGRLYLDRDVVFKFPGDLGGVDDRHKNLLETLLTDVNDAWKAWSTVRNTVEMVRLRTVKDAERTL
ncbi:hypothetical protein GSI_12218 [Ganoderma sinense ZZ0214-1]|uniref:Uncharacterized protein n=1 Tax=Ganoderma sinense ZZ0214-1 TaxID=1077348 RepID=A0A2G8RY70_9APHY|nr:hypothetical protein GSI_12218 [Ganoderma sinense ZZ0214-1]